ncbi:MAG: glycosyltransferase family 4 protein [Pseudomonadota bacterium]
MTLVAPGRTVGIGLACAKGSMSELPMFCVDWGQRGLVGKLGRLLALLRTGYAPSLPINEERRLKAFLRQHRVTAILAEFGTSGCALRSFCKRTGIKLFVNFHGHDATVLGQRPHMRFAYRLLAKDADGIICGSRHFSEIVEDLGFPRRKISIIPCGVETDTFRTDVPKDMKRVVAVGRLTRKKRPDLAIRAFAHAHAKDLSLRLDIIGDGDQRDACETVIRELNVENAVTLHGAQPHSFVKDLVAKAGLFVQHSMTAENGDQESQGISLIEAMASGLPVVTTDHNGFSETVIDGETGLLSPEGDVAAMANNLSELARDTERARRFGAAGRARVEARYDAEVVSKQLASLVIGTQQSTIGHDTSLCEPRL